MICRRRSQSPNHDVRPFNRRLTGRHRLVDGACALEHEPLLTSSPAARAADSLDTCSSGISSSTPSLRTRSLCRLSEWPACLAPRLQLHYLSGWYQRDDHRCGFERHGDRPASPRNTERWGESRDDAICIGHADAKADRRIAEAAVDDRLPAAKKASRPRVNDGRREQELRLSGNPGREYDRAAAWNEVGHADHNAGTASARSPRTARVPEPSSPARRHGHRPTPCRDWARTDAS